MLDFPGCRRRHPFSCFGSVKGTVKTANHARHEPEPCQTRSPCTASPPCHMLPRFHKSASPAFPAPLPGQCAQDWGHKPQRSNPDLLLHWPVRRIFLREKAGYWHRHHHCESAVQPQPVPAELQRNPAESAYCGIFLLRNVQLPLRRLPPQRRPWLFLPGRPTFQASYAPALLPYLGWWVQQSPDFSAEGFQYAAV